MRRLVPSGLEVFTQRSEGTSDRNHTWLLFKNSEEENREVRSSDGDVSLKAAAND